MRIALLATVFSIVTLVAAQTPAHAGGWPGTSSYDLRTEVPGGVTLKRIWQRVNGR